MAGFLVEFDRIQSQRHRQKNPPSEKNKKRNVPFPLPTPNFRQHAKSLAPCAETHWSVSSMEGSLPAPVPHNEFLLKPHLRGSSKGPAKPACGIPNGTFSFQSSLPLLFCSPWKYMNRKILSLLFLLYNKRDLQYGRSPSQHRCCHWGLLESGTADADPIASAWHSPHFRGQLSVCPSPGNWWKDVVLFVCELAKSRKVGTASEQVSTWKY